MRIRQRRFARLIPLALGAIVLAGAAGPAAAGSPSTGPSLRLVATSSTVTATRYVEGDVVYVDTGLLLGAVGSALEIRARRADYDSPIVARQRIYQNGTYTTRTLPDWTVAKGFAGLADFFRVRLRDADGDLRAERIRAFCPSGGDQRITTSGPQEPTYPRACDNGPFTLGRVWGIDRGWATPIFGWSGVRFRVPDGNYTLKVAITSAYRELFDIAPEHSSVTIRLVVRTEDMGCDFGCPAAAGGEDPQHHLSGGPVRGPLGVAPATADPADDTIPDLIALPAWNMAARNDAGRDYIEFAAMIWNSGPAPLLVEGYRRDGQDVMDAYQYFFRDGDAVGRSRVGLMEYDERDGHDHWHFKQFGRYALLDSTRTRVVLSKKEAFCLAPTDAVDLTVRGADWDPGSGDLGTLCGGPTAIWVREALAAGWGDTYYQSVPGQSLDITNVPNGTYFVSVEANPGGLLYERTAANNRALRRVVLGGTRGDRTISVSPWHGMDI